MYLFSTLFRTAARVHTGRVRLGSNNEFGLAQDRIGIPFTGRARTDR
jgi:hypothetical protein